MLTRASRRELLSNNALRKVGPLVSEIGSRFSPLYLAPQCCPGPTAAIWNRRLLSSLLLVFIAAPSKSSTSVVLANYSLPPPT